MLATALKYLEHECWNRSKISDMNISQDFGKLTILSSSKEKSGRTKECSIDATKGRECNKNWNDPLNRPEGFGSKCLMIEIKYLI